MVIVGMVCYFDLDADADVMVPKMITLALCHGPENMITLA